jgi:hypothetical protein
MVMPMVMANLNTNWTDANADLGIGGRGAQKRERQNRSYQSFHFCLLISALNRQSAKAALVPGKSPYQVMDSEMKFARKWNYSTAK